MTERSGLTQHQIMMQRVAARRPSIAGRGQPRLASAAERARAVNERVPRPFHKSEL